VRIARRTPVLVAAALAASTGRLRSQTTEVALGIEALARRDVHGAETMFARGTTSANQAVRPAAWLWRGHVAWKFGGDTAAAARYLARALIEARDSSQVLLEIARLDGARHRYRDAVRTARDAMLRSADAERRGIAARAVVELTLDGAVAGRRTLSHDSVAAAAIAEVRDTMQARVARFEGRTVDAIALINAAAALGDSAGIRAGLRSYFALTDRPIAAHADSIRNSLPIVDAMLRGRLYQSAALYLRATEADLIRVEWKDALDYSDFIERLGAAAEQVYRSDVAGTARRGDMSRAINRLGRTLWSRLHWNGQVPEFYPGALYRELGRRFGAVISLESSRGSEELYLAHQLGAYAIGGAPIVVLDGVVTSGIDDWLLDGTGGRAGWVNRDTIYERRTGFTETPFRALVALTDPQSMPGEMFRITRDSTGDISRAQRDSLGYLPGVAARIFRQGTMALLDSAPSRAAFALAMYRELTSTSIVLHESRHVADARAGLTGSPAEDEYRAKLVEVSLAAHPRLAMTAILTPNIGDASPHGQANRRIMMGLARWIRQNGAFISGYDARTPALLQLPSLTDAQIRTAFASMQRP
jgi:hypothetical protein